MDYQFDMNELLIAISDVIDMADSALMQHQQRTTYIAIKMAKETNLNASEIERLFLASILHDIGAFTIKEKVDLHEFQAVDTNRHCALGYQLYQSLDWLKASSTIVYQHHTHWQAFTTSLEDKTTLCSQILMLADIVERKINKSKFLLLQKNRIVAEVNAISSDVIAPYVCELFLKVSSSDIFWFDLDTNNVQDVLKSLLTKKSIYLDIEGMNDLSLFLKNLIDFRSHSTANHSCDVSICAGFLAKLFHFSSLEIRLMEIAGNLHDIGKLAIPESIIEKPSSLTAEEFTIIKQHVYYTYKILNKVKGFERFAEWASQHHEKLNGEGYPFNLSESEISIGAKIFAVSDVYAALTENRAYRKAMPPDQVKTTLINMTQSGHLDSAIVGKLLEHQTELNKLIQAKHKESNLEYQLIISADQFMFTPIV